MLNNPDWDDLRFFLEVARTETLAQAARRLKVNASTVSRRLHRLESQLKTPLFKRGAEGHQLTNQGQVLISLAQKMEQQALTATEILQGQGEEKFGPVRLGTTEGFGSHFLAPRLSDFCQANPQLVVELLPLPRFVKLTRQEADMAVTVEKPALTSLVISKLCDYRLKLYAAKSYLAKAPVLTSLEEVSQHRLIGYVDDLMFTDQLNYMDRLFPASQPVFRSTSILAQFEMCKAGLGLAILPCFMAQSAPELKPVLDKQLVLTRSFWLAAQPERKRLARVEALWQEVKRLAKKHQKQLLG